MLFISGYYSTAIFGKWHLSCEKTPPESLPYNPDKQGFDEYFVTWRTKGFSEIRKDWIRKSGTVGSSITFNNGTETISGIFQDIDNDGDMDAFIANHHAPSRLMQNDGHGFFKDITSSIFLNVYSIPKSISKTVTKAYEKAQKGLFMSNYEPLSGLGHQLLIILVQVFLK